MVVELRVVSALDGDAPGKPSAWIGSAGNQHLRIREPRADGKHVHRWRTRHRLLSERTQGELRRVESKRGRLERRRRDEVRPDLATERKQYGRGVAAAVCEVRRPSALELEPVSVLHHRLRLRISKKINLSACRGAQGKPHHDVMPVTVIPVAHALGAVPVVSVSRERKRNAPLGVHDEFGAETAVGDERERRTHDAAVAHAVPVVAAVEPPVLTHLAHTPRVSEMRLERTAVNLRIHLRARHRRNGVAEP